MGKNSKESVLLLRGILRERRHWGDFLPLIKQKLPEREIISLDIPGNGELHQQISPKTIPAMTESLRTQMNHAGSCHVIALSMGGMIAIDWMIRYPNEITSAVLINTSVGSISPFYQRLRWQRYLTILRIMLVKPEHREKIILALTSNNYADDQQLLENWRMWLKECPVSSANAFRQISASAAFSASTRPSQPLLIIKSRQDQLVHPQCSSTLAQQWGAKCIEHPSAGHDIPLDQPEWLGEQVREWLSCR